MKRILAAALILVAGAAFASPPGIYVKPPAPQRTTRVNVETEKLPPVRFFFNPLLVTVYIGPTWARIVALRVVDGE